MCDVYKGHGKYIYSYIPVTSFYLCYTLKDTEDVCVCIHTHTHTHTHTHGKRD